MIPYCDYMTNSVTTFLMLGRNRKYLYKQWSKLTTYCRWMCGRCCSRLCIQMRTHRESTGRRTFSERYDANALFHDSRSDDSVLSATAELLQQQKPLFLSPQQYTNYQATKLNPVAILPSYSI
mmetsp:Transcript_62075/g.98788  ORF Transcript_62075/g.98788 Transcript_62075/m.98788 type:complete len:123 (+) Transcript_62075:3-371(+)